MRTKTSNLTPPVRQRRAVSGKRLPSVKVMVTVRVTIAAGDSTIKVTTESHAVNLNLPRLK